MADRSPSGSAASRKRKPDNSAAGSPKLDTSKSMSPVTRSSSYRNWPASKLTKVARVRSCGTLRRSHWAMKRMMGNGRSPIRSEEHTSELQSLMRLSYAVFCLKKNIQRYIQVEEQCIRNLSKK